jgi:hypothetical protein
MTFRSDRDVARRLGISLLLALPSYDLQADAERLRDESDRYAD